MLSRRRPMLRSLSVGAAFGFAALASSYLVTRADVAWVDVLAWFGYLAAFLTLPGVLVWRLLWTGGRGSLLEHLVFGTLLGMILQFPIYLTGVAIGVPRLTVLLPLVVVAVCLLRPNRRDLFLPAVERVAPGMAWTIAAATTYATVWETQFGWAAAPSWGRAPADPTGDQTFQLALVSELRHHVPPMTPYVDDVPMSYHWFANEFLAAASWWNDAPARVLLDRFLLPTCIGLILCAVAVIAHRLTGAAWAGAVAVGIMTFVGDFSPFRWSTIRSNFDERFLSYADPVSPSLQFSVALFLLMTYVLLHVIRAPRITWRDVVLMVLATALLPLAKASTVPIMLGGLAAVVAMRMLLERTFRRREFLLFGLAVATFFVAQVVIFSGAGQVLKLDPLHIAGYVGWNLGLNGPDGGAPVPQHAAAKMFATTGLVLSWTCSAAGAFGFARGCVWRDPRAIFLVGAGAAGIVIALLFGHPHLAEDYFARTAVAPLAIASAWGLWNLLRGRSASQAVGLVGGGMVVGFLIALAASLTTPAQRPVLTDATQNAILHVLLRPYLVTAALLAVFGGAVIVMARRQTLARTAAVALILSAVIGLGLLRVPGTIRALMDAQPVAAPAPHSASIGRGGERAATWLRDHSEVGDLVATNAHYLKPGSRDNRHFWIAALAERRVLLEGWGYTNEVTEASNAANNSSFYQPFWNPLMLERNDRAFTEPTEDSLEYLRHRGVRWLFVDDRFPVDLAGLHAVADERFHRGRYRIFRLD